MSFSCIKVEGGLIPSELIEAIGRGEAPGQRPEDFGLKKNRRLTDEIAAAWSDARVYWEAFKRALRRIPQEDPGTTPTREQWVIPLLNVLGYDKITYMPKAAQVGGSSYFISHRAGSDEEAPPIHIVGYRADLDRRSPTGRPRLSPHALVQEYLNRSECLWGIVTNGRVLRILRDSARIIRPVYIEFDLEQMFNHEKFTEFAVFYRLVHRTRLPITAAEADQCWLERYYQQGIESGGRVREHLRDGVEQALLVLANGFLTHPANEDLRQKFLKEELTPLLYYQELLRLIYRILFLMVAEERELVTIDDPYKNRIYQDYYSISRLRRLAERNFSNTGSHGDLWLGLLTTFRLFREESIASPLELTVLDGELFSPTALEDLERAQLFNYDLLQAMRYLSLYRENNVWRRVNYAALDVEELGSVYEGLLEYRPMVNTDINGKLQFNLHYGTERKSTGSYYTRPELVNELVKSTVEPVIEAKLKQAITKEEKINALLSLKVVDPACGSGHFLLAAARKIGRVLAQIRTGEEEPTPTEFRRAVRDVITHCLYGVDLNPLAVELCKLTLWIEGHVAGRPLTYLDYRIKCGNSLIGALPECVEQGIPDEAFEAVTGDDRRWAQALKRRNRQEREAVGQGQISINESFMNYGDLRGLAIAYDSLAKEPEDHYLAVQRKARLYSKIRGPESEWEYKATAANLWTAAFFCYLKSGIPVPTFKDLKDYLNSPAQIDPKMIEHAWQLAKQYRFFHWHLEFTQVFESGGFDIVLGNPPWEMIELKEEEYWADDPYICEARNKAERSRRINEYRQSTDPRVRARVALFDEAKHEHECISKFVRQSGRFWLTAKGRINYFALFAELAQKLLAPGGRAGLVLPTGIATDDNCKQFFNYLVDNNILVSLYDFENREGLFPGVDSRQKFCLLTMRRSDKSNYKENKTLRFAFFLTRTEQLADERRVFSLTASDLALLNPNTKTCPVFRTKADAELTRKIYKKIPVLINESIKENPWRISFKQGLFNIASDSYLFKTFKELKSEGFILEGNRFVGGDITYLPLYEAKMMHQYDHRFGTYEGVADNSSNTSLPTPTPEQYSDPHYTVLPRYWVEERYVLVKTAKVPEIVRDALIADNEKVYLQALLYWVVGYNANHGASVRLPEKLLGGKATLSVDEIKAQLMEEEYPLNEEDIQIIIKAKSVREAVISLVRNRAPRWFLGFRNITNATNERTAIFGILPRVGVGHSLPLVILQKKISSALVCCLFANLNSMIYDYVTRQKIGGTNFTFFILKQLPVLPPTTYDEKDLIFIVPRVLELTYTAVDLEPFARDVWHDAGVEVRRAIISRWQEAHKKEFPYPVDYQSHDLYIFPFPWDEERRSLICAELDTYFARLYGLTRDELSYILDPKDVYGEDFPGETFRVLKENEINRFGEYRTRRLILEAWDKMFGK